MEQYHLNQIKEKAEKDKEKEEDERSIENEISL